MSTRHIEKKREEKKIYIAHVQEKYKERDRSCKGVHLLSTKNIGPLDQVV